MAILDRYKERLEGLKGAENNAPKGSPGVQSNQSNQADAGPYAKQGSFGQRFKKYFPQVWVELKKVTWPKRKEIVRGTWIVIGVSLATAIVLGVSDVVFQYILKLFI